MPLPHTNPQCFIVRANQDRHERPGHIGPDINRVKISATDTNGALAVLAYEGRAPGGSPLHMHPIRTRSSSCKTGAINSSAGMIAWC